jgi:hypothetical protein
VLENDLCHVVEGRFNIDVRAGIGVVTPETRGRNGAEDIVNRPKQAAKLDGCVLRFIADGCRYSLFQGVVLKSFGTFGA